MEPDLTVSCSLNRLRLILPPSPGIITSGKKFYLSNWYGGRTTRERFRRRPSSGHLWFSGPRDRNVVRRTLNILRSPFGAIVGSGTNRVPCVVVEELVPAIVRSATLKSSIGKSYNLSGRTPITQLEYMNLHASAAGLRCLKRKIPFQADRCKFGST